MACYARTWWSEYDAATRALAAPERAIYFVLGLVFDVLLWPHSLAKIAYPRFLMWRMERQFEASKRRMIGCRHERTVVVDVGTPMAKCLRCWALHIPAMGQAPAYWNPNVVPPSQQPAVPPVTRAPIAWWSCALALLSGAAYEGCSVVWVHCATGGSAAQTAVVSAVQALAQVLGIGESVRDWRVAPFFVAGYGLGAYIAMGM